MRQPAFLVYEEQILCVRCGFYLTRTDTVLEYVETAPVD